jgi:hypothetical protein
MFQTVKGLLASKKTQLYSVVIMLHDTESSIENRTQMHGKFNGRTFPYITYTV